MKRILSSVLIVIALLTTLSNIRADGAMAIGDRVNDPTLNILDSATITFTDSNGNAQVNPTVDSLAYINFVWSIPDEVAMYVQAGDTYSFDLPTSFKVSANVSGNLGSGFGTYTITTDNHVVFTFSNQVSTHSNVNGNLTINAKLNDAEITSPGPHKILIPIRDGEEFTINIESEMTDKPISKAGVLDSAVNPHSVNWTVEVNKNYQTLTNVNIVDTLPASVSMGTYTVNYANYDHKGKFLSLGDTVDPALYTYDSLTHTFHFNQLSQPVIIKMNTPILNSVKPEDGGTVAILNTVDMTADGMTPLQTTATVTANYGKYLEKTNTSYTGSTQTFGWSVVLNAGEKAVTAPLVTDTFDNRLEYVPNSLKIVSNADGSTFTNYSLTNSPANTLNIQFNQDITSKYTITYQTRAKDGTLITSNTAFSNTVTSNGKTSTTTKTANPQLLAKTTPSIDYNQRTINWQMTVNQNKYLMKNPTITDTYDFSGLTFKTGSLVVRDTAASPAKTLVAGTDYDFVKTTDANGVETGFTIVFKNTYQSTSSSFTITYTTDYDFNNLNVTSTNPNKVFRNTGKLSWSDENDVPHSNSSTVDRNPRNETKNNGSKSGNYNAITKEITWSINVNYNDEETLNAKLVDTIANQGQYVENSLVISEYTIAANGTVTVGASVPLSNFSITYPTADLAALTIGFPDGEGKQYHIEYRTTLAGTMIQSAPYTNTAVYSNQGKTPRSLTASLSVNNGGEILDKSGSQRGNYVDWTLHINESQSYIEDAVISDVPSSNQILMPDTLKLYPTIMNSNGTYTIDTANPLVLGQDYTVTYATDSSGKNISFQLKFMQSISKTYVLQYSSQIYTTPTNTTLTNAAYLSGNQVTYSDQPGSSDLQIVIGQTDGNAVGETTSLTILKTNEQGVPLAGVSFDLYSPLGNKVASIQTDANGRYTFTNLIYGKYKLYERNTLSGYVISDDLYNGHQIIVNAASAATLTNPLTFTNRKNLLTITKENSNLQVLPGAVFKLESFDGTTYTSLNDHLEVTDGSIALEGLPVGSYRLTELTAPAGYIRNSTPYVFTIDADGNQQAVDKTVPIVNYQGSVRLSKVDHDGHALAGVKYQLYTESGTAVGSTLTSDGNGWIDVAGLAPGSYKFIEISSTKGNIVNPTPISFVIPEAVQGIPETLQLTATNSKGNVVLTKVSATGQPLTGVEYQLFRTSDNQVVATAFSAVDGKVSFSQIDVGNYYVQEVTALPTYVLDTQKYPVEIPETATVEVYTADLGEIVNQLGQFTIHKIDSTGRSLAEATFKLERLEGTDYLLVDDAITTKNGVITLNGYVAGDYRLTEIAAPANYLLNQTPTTFTIKTDGTGDATDSEIFFVDYQGSVRLTKVDSNERTLTGVQYELLDASGTAIKTDLTTDIDGQLVVTGLAPGRYSFVETRSADGNIINPTPIEFVIQAAAAGEPEQVEVTSTNSKGSIELTKVNEQGQPLTGVGYQLVRSGNGAVIATAYSDGNGKVSFSQVDVGEYYIQEISTLTGYILDTEKITAVIPESALNGAVTVNLGTFVNARGQFIIHKVDRTGESLSEATFLIKNVTDNTVLGNFTTENGILTLTNLDAGSTYSYEETAAPSGYALDQQVYLFTIPDQVEGTYTPETRDVVNYEAKIILPNLGVEGQQTWLWAIALIAAGSLVLILVKQRRKHQ